MERWIAIVLGLLVIVIGFVVVQNITDATTGIGDTGSDVECLVQGGSCVEAGSCAGEELAYACREGRTCCDTSS